MSASSPKYQRRYQSGRGSAASMLGSGGLSNGGGPTKNAATAIAMIKRVATITSRQARSGQNGLPLFLSSSSYSARYVAGLLVCLQPAAPRSRGEGRAIDVTR